jgi:hypothetical protein
MTSNPAREALTRNINRLIAEGAPVVTEIPTNDAIIARAEALGAEHGSAAGSWVIDGNTTAETAQGIVRGYEDGDPMVMDMQPAPLSGEWADSMTPQELIHELTGEEYDLHSDEFVKDAACDAYEHAYSQAYWDQVVSDARGFGHV